MKEWVVDTWVLATCNDTDCDGCLDCLDFLANLLRKGKLCLDTEEDIDKEYDPYIKPRTYLFWWWNRMTGQVGHLCRKSNTLAGRHERKLVNTLHFDSDDIKFVGVASKSRDKIIVSGDSDYNETVCSYLQGMLGIEVMNPSSALNHM